jgi:hypothetical protein
MGDVPATVVIPPCGRRPDVKANLRAGRPASVLVALGALAIVIAVQLALALLVARSGAVAVGWGQFLFAAVVAVLLLVELARRSRLAWLWGRYLTFFLAALETAALAVGVVQRQITWWQVATGFAGLALPLLVVSIALSRSKAYAYYDLVCPICGARTSFGATFLFRQARCRGCDNVW